MRGVTAAKVEQLKIEVSDNKSASRRKGPLQVEQEPRHASKSQLRARIEQLHWQ